MQSSARILIAIATYNEIENLPDLVAGLLRIAPDAKILVIDDNSPDGTGDWCEGQAQQEARLQCMHRTGKLGLGSATVEAMKFALARDFDCLLTMDADLSHHPKYVPMLRDRMTQGDPLPDVVIGSRYVPGGAIEGWPLHRRLMSRAINTYAKLALGLPVSDCSGAFRLYQTDALRRLDLEQMVSQGYSYLEEILWRLKRRGAHFAEVPIVFTDRQRGETKINLREAATALFLILRFALQRIAGRE